MIKGLVREGKCSMQQFLSLSRIRMPIHFTPTVVSTQETKFDWKSIVVLGLIYGPRTICMPLYLPGI